MGLVRDPQFWKRFSLAVHMAEGGGGDPEKGPQSATSTVDMKNGYASLSSISLLSSCS